MRVAELQLLPNELTVPQKVSAGVGEEVGQAEALGTRLTDARGEAEREAEELEIGLRLEVRQTEGVLVPCKDWAGESVPEALLLKDCV